MSINSNGKLHSPRLLVVRSLRLFSQIIPCEQTPRGLNERRFIQKKPKVLKRTLSIIFLGLSVAFSVRDASTKTGSTVAPCKVGRQAAAIGFWTWASNAHVKVYVRSADFNTEQIPYLLTALQNWSNVSELTGSGVKFDYAGSTTRQLTCENCLTITRGPLFDKAKRHATELRVYSAHSDQIITYASIMVDSSLTNPKALLDAIVHELGHNLGLLDCYSCESKSTLMTQFKAMNVPKEIDAPTPCDIAQVKEAYQELKLRVRRSPSKGRSIFEDEGEEPIDDDTPIVIPKP